MLANLNFAGKKAALKLKESEARQLLKSKMENRERNIQKKIFHSFLKSSHELITEFYFFSSMFTLEIFFAA